MQNIRHYDTTILQYRKKRLRFRAGSGILRAAETDSGCAALFGIGESQKKTFEIVKRSIAI